MNHKNIYEILNDATIDLTLYEQETINDIEKKRIKKAVLKNPSSKARRFKPAIVAAAFMVLCIGAATIYPNDVYAFIKGLQYKLNMFIIAEEIDGYVQSVHSTVMDQNVAVTLNEVVMDNDELIVTTTIAIEEAAGELLAMHTTEELIIDGKSILSGSSGAMIQNGNTFESYTVYDISGYNINPEKAHTVNYTITDILCIQEDSRSEISGKWSFEFFAEGQELLADTISVPLEYTIVLPDGNKWELNKYTSNALGQKIYFDIPDNGGLTRYLVELRGHDDKNRDVVFYTSHTKKDEGILKIETIDNGYIQEDATILSLTPYVMELPKESGRMNNDYTPLDMEIKILLK